tara:strand:- start:313 stop:630 length:318 start_codon:yes stop_codon:yes gene_type:complete
MKLIKRVNIKKKDIIHNVFNKVGIPSFYASKILNDLIDILILDLHLYKVLKIKNFGTFKLMSKKERKGRNPKNKLNYVISERKVVTFKSSDKLKNKININAKKKK